MRRNTLASQGFVVIQPTYLDSRSIGLADDDPRRPGIWRQRASDATNILDHLDEVLAPNLDKPVMRWTVSGNVAGNPMMGAFTREKIPACRNGRIRGADT